MPLVKALKDVYLGEHGYHSKDEVFEYAGPKNGNLEPVKRSKAESETPSEA